MASESTTSNVLLTGQSAYVKKNGSMVNHGTIERQNALTAYSMNTEGYIGPNSVLHGTDLADTNEYLQCESVMKSYLGENWEEDPQERTIITNSNKIKTLLLPGENNMNTLANNIIPNYQECNYIYWYSGTGYFNTGINATNVYGIEFTFRPYSTVTNAYSSLLSGVLDNFTIGTGGESGVAYRDIYLRWRTIEKLQATTELPSFGSTNPVTITIKNGKCKINGIEQCDIDTTQAVSTATGNIYIGNNSGLTRAGNLYFHGLKLYDNAGQLLANMIPVYVNGNTYCIFDKISKKMIYNSGTGSISGSTKTNYTLLEYLETNGTGSFRLNYATMLNAILNYPSEFGFELDFMPLDTFDTTSTYGDKPYLAFGSMGAGDSTRSKFMGLYAKKDFSNGAIHVGYSCEPVDARLQLGKRQTISFANGVLTRPDGSTVNLGTPDIEPGITRTYIEGRLGASFEPNALVIDNPYTTMRVYDLKVYTHNMTYHFEPVLYSNIARLRFKTSATSIAYSTISYGGTYCKPGPIKIEEGGNE